jgi:RNA polymerase sigma-70 factor, ECF subfamily
LERLLFFKKADPQMKEFSDIFEEHKNLVYKTAFLMFGNREEADEALQEVFILIFRSLSKYDPAKGAMTTWLHRITINYCLGYRRKHQVTIEPLDGLTLIAPNESVENHIQQVQLQLSVRDAIFRLSEKQRAVIILRYYWDLSYKEIGQILAIPLGTVKSRIDLALRSLGSEIYKSTAEMADDFTPIWENVP